MKTIGQKALLALLLAFLCLLMAGCRTIWLPGPPGLPPPPPILVP